MKLARLLQARGITDIEVVIFDTHGESIGRGAHPVSLAQRFSHLASPMSRSLFADADIPLKQEISFQGGDGYCLLATPRLALGTVTQVLAHAMRPIRDPLRSLIFTAADRAVTDVFVGGEQVLRDGEPTGIDVQDALDRMDRARETAEDGVAAKDWGGRDGLTLSPLAFPTDG